MKLLSRMKFKWQMLLCFFIVIFFISFSFLALLGSILRESYRVEENDALNTQGRQLLINIENRLDYFIAYLELLSMNREMRDCLNQQRYSELVNTIKDQTSEFMKINTGRVNAIRIHRKNVYAYIDGYGTVQDVFTRMRSSYQTKNNDVFITGTYLNSRNEKVFSVFYRVFMADTMREYMFEMCIYETEIFSYFNKNNNNPTVIACNDQILSMNNRERFANLLLDNKGTNGVIEFQSVIDSESKDNVVSVDGEFESMRIVIEGNDDYIRKAFVIVIGKMIPVILVVSSLALLFSILLAHWVSRKFATLLNQITGISEGNLSQVINSEGHDEFALVSSHLDQTRVRIVELINENNVTQENMRKAEMSALRAQINSHFLFNSLSSIKWLAKQNDIDRLNETVDNLAVFLRYSLAINENQVQLKDELKQLNAYASLQKLRYGDDVNLVIDISEELYDCLTVRMILQPLVENAIFHGRRLTGERLNISVYSEMISDEEYCMIVEDDGVGIAKETIDAIMRRDSSASRSGYGLCNVIERLSLCLGKPYDEVMKIESVPDQFTIIRIYQPVITPLTK